MESIVKLFMFEINQLYHKPQLLNEINKVVELLLQLSIVLLHCSVLCLSFNDFTP